jgi:hypothetical protein
MEYQQITASSQYAYPSHNIAPDKKDADWCMAYAKAAYWDWNFSYLKGIFSSNGGDYEKFRMYALGKQSISQYKKWLGVDQQNNNTQLVVDWSVRAIVSGYRDKAISQLMKEEYNIIAVPIDMLSKSEIDAEYNKLKAKLAVRQLTQQQNPELANHPQLQLGSNDPQDIDELQMRIDSGEQFNRAKDAEMAIELGFYENDYHLIRKAWYEDLFDYGVAGYREWLGDDNKAKFRRVNPDAVIINYCRDSTFKDLIHAGEEIDVSLVDLAMVQDKDGNDLFTEEELTFFASSIAGKYGNPPGVSNRTTGFLKPYDKFKCKVFDISFYTYNDSVYKDTTDENGNTDFRKAEYGRGKQSDKYKRKRIQYVYKCKWIVGTDKCYDWGMCYDQKRASDNKKKAATKLPYSFCAYNFYEMKCQSIMSKLIPYIDDYQLTMMKIQNWKNRSIPSGWWINLDALENVALNKGGKNMQPHELLKMFTETGIIVGRTQGADGQSLFQNTQPIIPISNSIMAELAGFYNDLLQTIATIEKMVGFNDITNGNPNPKTLVPGYDIANQATINSLYPLAQAEEYLTLNLSEDVLCRMKQGIKKGEVSGYAPYKGALGGNTLKFIELDEGMSLRDYGIMLEKGTTEQEKVWILQQLNADIANGFLDVSDAILIIETHNAKQALQVLSYRVKKAKQNANQQKMAEIQSQNQGLAQQAQITTQAAQQQLQATLASKEKIAKMEIDGDIEKKRIEMQAQILMNQQTNQSRVGAASITADAKISSHILDGHSAIAKQEKANEKSTAE